MHLLLLARSSNRSPAVVASGAQAAVSGGRIADSNRSRSSDSGSSRSLGNSSSSGNRSSNNISRNSLPASAMSRSGQLPGSDDQARKRYAKRRAALQAQLDRQLQALEAEEEPKSVLDERRLHERIVRTRCRRTALACRRSHRRCRTTRRRCVHRRQRPADQCSLVAG